jgi:hypothetical protein
VNNRKLVLGLLVILSFPYNQVRSNPQDIVVPCTNCTQDIAAWKATHFAPPGEETYVYIADFKTEQLWRFHSMSTISDVGVRQVSILSEVDEGVLKEFQRWLSIKDIDESTQHSLSADTGIQSVYDLVNNSQNQLRVAEYLFENQQQILDFPVEVLSDHFSLMGQAASQYFSQMTDIRIQLAFDDGSHAEYKLVFSPMVDEITVNYKFEPELTTDSHGSQVSQSH